MAHDSWYQTWNTVPAPTPAGHAARIRSSVVELYPLVQYNFAPPTAFAPGVPLPGPPATAEVMVDYDSMRFWGHEGSGIMEWSGGHPPLGELPAQIPQGLAQHIDVWSYFAGGYPSIERSRPASFASLVPPLDPNRGWG